MDKGNNVWKIEYFFRVCVCVCVGFFSDCFNWCCIEGKNAQNSNSLVFLDLQNVYCVGDFIIGELDVNSRSFMVWMELTIDIKGLLILIYSWHQKFKFCTLDFVQGICNVVHVWRMWICVDVGAPNVASFFVRNRLLSWGFNLWCFWEVGVIFVNIFLFWDLTRNHVAWLLDNVGEMPFVQIKVVGPLC